MAYDPPADETPWFHPTRTPKLALIVLALVLFMFVLARIVDTRDPPRGWDGHGDDLVILHVFEIGCLLIMAGTYVHAWKRWGRKRATFFFIFALVYGFILEEITVTQSGYYEYNPNSWIMIGSTQMAVPFCWTAVIYTCIRTIEERKELRGLAKIEKGLLAGVLAVSIDVGIDAVFANYGLWRWEEWQWLGVPLANYTAWFMAVGGFTVIWTDIREMKVPTLFKEISMAAGVVLSYGLLLLMVYITYIFQWLVFG
jgi:uncharacterized membrane protein